MNANMTDSAASSTWPAGERLVCQTDFRSGF